MENVLRQSSGDQSFSPYKHMKNQRKNTRGGGGGFVSKPGENMYRGGILLAPPPLTSYSYPPPPSLSLHNYQQQQLQLQQPPPLLPLPIHNPLPSRSRYLSCPPINRKPNRARDQSLLMPKKSNPKQPMKREVESKKEVLKPTEKTISESLIVVTSSSVNPSGPDPNDLPKDVSKVLSSAGIVAALKNFEKFSGSVFVSPPPSSLPLPKFSLRPKLISCNAEAAAGVDAGATDNLRRLLRLR